MINHAAVCLSVYLPITYLLYFTACLSVYLPITYLLYFTTAHARDCAGGMPTVGTCH